MRNNGYLYKYVVRDQETGESLAEFDSNTVPPPVGANIDVAEFVKSLDNNPVFRIVGLRYQPFRFDNPNAVSDQMLVDLVVRRAGLNELI